MCEGYKQTQFLLFFLNNNYNKTKGKTEDLGYV